MNIIDKRNLFGNENNAFILCEYQREVKLINDIYIKQCNFVAQRPMKLIKTDCI